MVGKRISGRGMSMSPAAKKILKTKQRRKKLGIPEKAEAEASKKVLVVLVVAGLVVVGLVVAGILAGSGFGRG